MVIKKDKFGISQEKRIFAGLAVAILLLSSLLLYFNEDNEQNDDYYMGDNGLVPVWERVNQNFNTTGSYSYTLVPGQYDIVGPESVFIDVDLPSSELVEFNTYLRMNALSPIITIMQTGLLNRYLE